jgi:hypothetical protein
MYYKKLEDRTNIGAAIQTAASYIRNHHNSNSNSNTTYSVVFASDGADTVNNHIQLEQTFDAVQSLISGCGATIRMTVVGIGSSSSTKIGVQAQAALQTTTNDVQSVFYARTHGDTKKVVADLVQSEKEGQRCQMITYQLASAQLIPPPGGLVLPTSLSDQSGFLRSAKQDEPPVHAISARWNPQQSDSVGFVVKCNQEELDLWSLVIHSHGVPITLTPVAPLEVGQKIVQRLIQVCFIFIFLP